MRGRRGYSRLQRGIVSHPVRVTGENGDELREFDFAFVHVDTGSARREIAAGLHRLSIPFVDTGIGVGHANHRPAEAGKQRLGRFEN